MATSRITSSGSKKLSEQGLASPRLEDLRNIPDFLLIRRPTVQRSNRHSLNFKLSSSNWRRKLASLRVKLRNTSAFFNVAQITLFYSFAIHPRLVLTTLNEALEKSPDRKCFRLIGGVLVERTVKDIVPALRTNRDGASPFPSSSRCRLMRSPH